MMQNVSNNLVTTVVDVFLKENFNENNKMQALIGSDYQKGSYKKLNSVFSENFSKVFSLHYNSFKGIFKNDNVELSSRFQAFMLALFRFSFIRLSLWFFCLFSSDLLDEEVLTIAEIDNDVNNIVPSFDVNFNEVEFDDVLGLSFLFLDLIDLELNFLNSIAANMRVFALNSSKSIANFLYSTYSVYGRVPLLPEFHLVVMRNVLPYILRNFLSPLAIRV